MEIIENEKNIINNPFEDVMHRSMIPYAEYVILDRAIPRVEDGLKPVQRRIIYSMYEQAMYPDKGYKKSARVVGDCLAKYHPHGDTSVYDAMVRLAQPYNMRMTLVDGQGNFGSIDGDPAAAMRYTEVKMQPLALELVKDIEKDTVKWNLNFDDSLKEPDVLPSHYPNLLVNGATGIAVGLATNIPTHNLGEVIEGACAYIENPKISLEEMMKIVPGPDFPTGGYIIAGEELKKAYSTGKGKIYIRAKLHVEEGEKGGKSIIITEIPYTVNKADMLRKIDDMCSGADEKKRKPVLEDNILSVSDESDRNGMRAVIRLKKDANVDKTLEALYKYSDLQISFGINTVVIADGKPQQLGLLDIFRYYTEFQREVVLRRTKHDHEKAKERAHILEGLIIAVTNIDEVIRIIKTSPDTQTARQNLRKAFSLSERQASAILDLRLARLTKLEVNNLKEELKNLLELIKEYEAIIASKRRQFEVVTREMRAVKKKFGDERRSEIVSNESEISIKKSEDKPVIETCIVGVNAKGKIRKLKLQQFKRITENQTPTQKDVLTSYTKVTTEETVYAFSNLGNCFKLDVEVLPESKGSLSEGVKLDDVCREAKKNEKIVAVFPIKGIEMPEGRLVFITKQGMIKVTPWSEFAIIKGYFQAMKVKDGDEIITIEKEDPEKTVLYITQRGMSLNMLYDGMPEQGRVAGGVKGMTLFEGDEVVFAR
ncbi:MAG: DNA topoisomerase 4 subunit A, partial [Clostridia bacterium]|nr:DNA topoisomerase 4 subunit A [Clostridia bacterium]